LFHHAAKIKDLYLYNKGKLPSDTALSFNSKVSDWFQGVKLLVSPYETISFKA